MNNTAIYCPPSEGSRLSFSPSFWLFLQIKEAATLPQAFETFPSLTWTLNFCTWNASCSAAPPEPSMEQVYTLQVRHLKEHGTCHMQPTSVRLACSHPDQSVAAVFGSHLNRLINVKPKPAPAVLWDVSALVRYICATTPCDLSTKI